MSPQGEQILSRTNAFVSNFLTILILVGIVIFLLYSLSVFIKNRRREKYALNFVTLLVKLPKSNEIKIDAAEQMFAGLYSLKKVGAFSFLEPEETIGFEIIGMKEDIAFYVTCPRHIQDLVEKQINGAYPSAAISEVDEVNIFSDTGRVAFSALKLDKANFYPIKTYKDLATDGLSLITSALSKMGDGEGATLQILLQPAGRSWQIKGERHNQKQKKQEANPDTASYTHDPKEVEAINTKISKPGFKTAIRMVVSANNDVTAKAHLNNLIGAFSQFSSPHNEFKRRNIFFKHSFMIDFIYRYLSFIPLRKTILNTEELATLMHFPNKTVETHHMRWLSAKSAPASNKIPTKGLYLGKSKYRGVERGIYMSLEDRRRHTYIIGKTGTGKSEFLKDLALQDIQNGQGVAVIDPHGDLVEDLLQLMPPERAEDVIYFNPADTERPLGMNIMEAHNEEQQQFMASAVIGLMYKLYDPHRTGIVGPRFEHAIRNGMLTIMAKPGATFIELVRILTDAKYVEDYLPFVKDPMVKRYWTDQIASTSDFHKSEVLDYIVSKFGRFVTNKTMRNIIGQSESAFDFRKAMDEKKIILCNLSKGVIGEEDAKFLGLILVPKILTAAMSRQNVSMDKRNDFFLYVDEFQNFATEDFASILSEARKYRLNLIVANQFIGQIEEDIKNAVFGNVGTMVAFRVGVTDANFLQHEFSPTFNETDLANVDKYHAYVKTIVDNQPVSAFSMSLLKDIKAQEAKMNPKLSELIKKLSRLKYGKDKELLEEEIGQRAQLL